jgi:hypothetical protein
MKKDVSKYAKIDPAFLTDGLFVPRANKNKAINIENHLPYAPGQGATENS